ncbi:MAG: MBL fold metallo-hydrolase [Deltaproteobacteria bacterium]|nr:MBL fold metallo-hydrolase [Deltaproteobacteria bacterium]
MAVLGSGSRGNAVVVESEGNRVLIDAGFSCRQLVLRLESLGVTPESIDAVLLTHEHSDHTRGVDVFSHRYGTPVFGTEGTLDGLSMRAPGEVFRSGHAFELCGFEVEPFAIPHDAREPVGLVLESKAGRRMGLAADLGSRTQLAWARLRDLDMLILETNHDLEMLRSGPYPWVLKQRVAGRHGHLSNTDAAEGIPELLSDRLEEIVLYHLSQTNNLPALAASTVGEALDRSGSAAVVTVSSQGEPTRWIEVASEVQNRDLMER